MNEKKRSAVGAATPATENIENSTVKTIPDQEEKIKIPEKIKAVMQRPGQLAEIVEIENTAEALNQIVGGMATGVIIPDDRRLLLFMNTNSSRKGTSTLKTLWGRIFGTVIIVARAEDEWFSMTPEHIQSARGWLLKHTYEEEKEWKR